MEINVVSLLVMFCSGIAAATVVDFVRYIVRAARMPMIRKASSIIEIVVWAFLGCATFYLLLRIKAGDWRAVDALAQVFGIIAYSVVLRRPIRIIAKLLSTIFFSPFLWIGTLFVAVIRKFVKVFIRIIKRFKGMMKEIAKK